MRIFHTLLTALLVSLAHASIVPTVPGANRTYLERYGCTVGWKLDQTGRWTSFSVDLMTGSNAQMKFVKNVLKNQDGTSNRSATMYTWECPRVTPHARIYFYQFTQAGEPPLWTTRFTIADPSGKSTAPPYPSQPDGNPIPWGTGRLVN